METRPARSSRPAIWEKANSLVTWLLLIAAALRVLGQMLWAVAPWIASLVIVLTFIHAVNVSLPGLFGAWLFILVVLGVGFMLRNGISDLLGK